MPKNDTAPQDVSESARSTAPQDGSTHGTGPQESRPDHTGPPAGGVGTSSKQTAPQSSDSKAPVRERKRSIEGLPVRERKRSVERLPARVRKRSLERL